MRTELDQKQPRGFILIVSLFVLMLLGLMGFALLANTRTELSITGETTQSRQAFAKADATAQLSVLLVRPLFQTSAGVPDDYITNLDMGDRPPFEITLTNFQISTDLDRVEDSLTEEEIRRRYLMATDADLSAVAADLRPQVTLAHEGEVVGNAYVTYYVPDTQTQGERDYMDVYFIISSDGRLPVGGGGDPGNYYEGSQETKHSIVTTIYKDILQGQ